MLLWILLSTPSYALTGTTVGGGGKTALCLFAPLCYDMGLGVIEAGEATQLGVQWGDFGTGNGDISIGAVIGMLLLDAVLYGVLAWYLDKVVPSEFGTPLPPTFCCRRSYWARTQRAPDAHEAAPLLEAERARHSSQQVRRGGAAAGAAAAAAAAVAAGAFARSGACARPAHARPDPPPCACAAAQEIAVEAVPAALAEKDAVHITGLSKTFPTKDGPKVALDDLWLSMYEGQITALLGHNGAGKTTTISMLTGLYPSTAGDAVCV